MSHQIYYDRAYIRVGDKYIPLVNSGSSNCFEVGFSGRQIGEKGWNVQNWLRSGQFLFTEDEIKAIARDYDSYNQECGMMYKSRNQCFAPGEMERWIINGMKRAYTVEEYVSFGNSFFVLDFSPDEIHDWKRHPFKTTADLLRILDELKDSKSLEIKLGYNREVYRPKTVKPPRKKLRVGDLPECYVLKGKHEANEIYFVNFTRNGGIRFYWHRPHNGSRVFKTERDAMKYLEKYNGRLGRYNFMPEKVENAA